MPLVRVEVRNEYGLGAPEMYLGANDDEPKEILEGVAVAGLVGVLRQLGDLADFAAEVFHGLQEEVMITYSRSHKLMGRIQRIEEALIPVEEAVLAQRSHLHFAYTAGSSWHTPTQCQKNHFTYSDVPQFILDWYEDCRGPPPFHLLDRFDPGGPGSCLKRYSDPTIFKKASATSGEASPEKVPKDKKGQKIKKRRSSVRNGELSRGTPFSHHSDRNQFTRVNVGGHTSPCQPISSCDVTLRSNLSEQSNIDRRNGSGYSKDDFPPSCSVQPREQESRDFIYSPQKNHGTDYIHHNFLKEKDTVACDDIHINLTQEQGVCSSYSGTWGEKTAVPEPAVQDYVHAGTTLEDNHDRNLELFHPKIDLKTLGDNAVNLETVDSLDVQTCNRKLRAFRSEGIHLDDFESEKYHFMDAYNTIEPESETDLNCMGKQNVDDSSKLEDKAAKDRLPELIKHNLEGQTSNSGYNTLADDSQIKGSSGHYTKSVSPKSHSAACSSTGRVPDKDECSSVSLVDKALLSAQSTGDSLHPGSPRSITSSGNGEINDSTNVESVSCTLSSNFRDDDSGMPTIRDRTSSQECEKLEPETSDVTSVTFWTNGCLLGLQPSKPSDCSVLNDLPQDHLSKNDGKISSSSQHIIISYKDPREPDRTDSFQKIVEDLDMDSSTCQEYQESGKSFRNKFWKISPPDVDITLGRTRTCDMLSLSGDESLMQSPSSSPPLVNMKISVQPIDGFKTSKLKLKFFNGDTNDERSGDVFPSFQLVPEVSTSQHDEGSDSDDDTFCGSSPSSRDDRHSHHSESNSEKWESGRSPNGKNPDLHDSFHKISLKESVSTVLGNGRTCHEEIHESSGVQYPVAENSMQTSHSCPFDLQRLETLNQSFQEELRNDKNTKYLVEPEFATAPDPPPLPPVRWRGTKPHLNDREYSSEVIPNGSNYASDLKHSASAFSQQPKPAPLNHDQIMETTNEHKSKMSNGRREAKQGKTIDESDFLHQIRTKSFILRPTVPAKPAVRSGISSSVQVTAILEKANAIRQAVGGDEGDDDGSWS